MGPGRWVASYLRMVPQNSAFSQSPKQQISSSFPLRRQLKAKTKGVNIWTCRVLGTTLWSTPESSSNLTSYKVPVKLSSQVAKQFYHPEPHRDKRRIFLCTGTSNKYDQIQDYGNTKLLQWKLFMFCTKENLAMDQKKHEKTHWNVGRTWQIKLVSKHWKLLHLQFQLPPRTMDSWLDFFRSLVLTLLYPLSLLEDKEDVTFQLLSSLSEIIHRWIILFVKLANIYSAVPNVGMYCINTPQ